MTEVEKEDPMGDVEFRGTVAAFKRYLGPWLRNVVKDISKKHKATVGECQHCGTTDGPFDAAHVHGRERVTIIHELLGASDGAAVVHVDLPAFQAAFKAEHTPVEKALLVLCKACHTAYDTPTPVAADPVVKEILPIVLHPRGVERFREALLETRAAWIDISYENGRVEREPWSAQKLNATSNVLGNLRSRPKFRAGAWQEAGIVAVHVSVAPPSDLRLEA